VSYKAELSYSTFEWIELCVNGLLPFKVIKRVSYKAELSYSTFEWIEISVNGLLPFKVIKRVSYKAELSYSTFEWIEISSLKTSSKDAKILLFHYIIKLSGR